MPCLLPIPTTRKHVGSVKVRKLCQWGEEGETGGERRIWIQGFHGEDEVSVCSCGIYLLSIKLEGYILLLFNLLFPNLKIEIRRGRKEAAQVYCRNCIILSVQGWGDAPQININILRHFLMRKPYQHSQRKRELSPTPTAEGRRGETQISPSLSKDLRAHSPDESSRVLSLCQNIHF